MNTRNEVTHDVYDSESGQVLFAAPARILSAASASGDVTSVVSEIVRSGAVTWKAEDAPMRRFLQRAGWDDWKSIDDETLRARVLWVAAGDFKESLRDDARAWRRKAKAGGPGLDSYTYDAASYCEDCAHAIIDAMSDRAIEECDPSLLDDDAAPAPSFFTESDSLQYCDDCGEQLDVSLTSDGVESTREDIADAIARGEPESIERRAESIGLDQWTTTRAILRAKWNARRRAALLARAPLLRFPGSPAGSTERAP